MLFQLVLFSLENSFHVTKALNAFFMRVFLLNVPTIVDTFLLFVWKFLNNLKIITTFCFVLVFQCFFALFSLIDLFDFAFLLALKVKDKFGSLELQTVSYPDSAIS